VGYENAVCAHEVGRCGFRVDEENRNDPFIITSTEIAPALH